MKDDLQERGERIEQLTKALRENDPFMVTSSVLQMIENDEWREFVSSLDHNLKRYDDFAFFCDRELQVHPERLLDAARMFPRDKAKIQAKIAELIARPVGTNQHVSPEGRNNITRLQAGTNASEGYSQLRKADRQDLLAQVDAGELSVHRACIQAGLRHPTATFRTDDLNSAVRVWLKHYERDDIDGALFTQDTLTASEQPEREIREREVAR